MSNEARLAYVLMLGNQYFEGFKGAGAGAPHFKKRLSDAQMYSSKGVAAPFMQMIEQRNATNLQVKMRQVHLHLAEI